MRKALTFDDVLMVPNFNPFPSRGDERISTETKLGNHTFSVPIISANMDTVTGAEMAKTMGALGGLGILHRFCSIEENVEMFQAAGDVGVSVGVNEGIKRAQALYDAGARLFCVDVAHGHSKQCGQIVNILRTELGSKITIIAGNVCTYAGCDWLVSCGADAIKVGIGPGCFIPGSLVKTSEGYLPIEQVKIGTLVYTHKNRLKRVEDTLQRKVSEQLIKVNEEMCTQEHEFFVVLKEHQHLVTEENLYSYGFWVQAKELDKEIHLLVELD